MSHHTRSLHNAGMAAAGTSSQLVGHPHDDANEWGEDDQVTAGESTGASIDGS